jgi:DNA replication protein DnaC
MQPSVPLGNTTRGADINKSGNPIYLNYRRTHMLLQPTLQQLRELKLLGMAQVLEEQINQPQSSSLSFEERIAFMLDRELSYRKNRKLQGLIKNAKFRYQACVEDIDYQHSRNLDKSQFASLAQCNWIRQKHNVIFEGPTGAGKSWLACALGLQACRQIISVKYFRLPRLLETLRIAHADGSYAGLISQIAKVQLIILDDWGIDILGREQRNDLLEILEDRYQQSATIITTQLPIKRWHEFIGEATIADAILDRVVHNAYHIKFNGDSFRRKDGKNLNKNKKEFD